MFEEANSGARIRIFWGDSGTEGRGAGKKNYARSDAAPIIGILIGRSKRSWRAVIVASRGMFRQLK